MEAFQQCGWRGRPVLSEKLNIGLSAFLEHTKTNEVLQYWQMLKRKCLCNALLLRKEMVSKAALFPLRHACISRRAILIFTLAPTPLALSNSQHRAHVSVVLSSASSGGRWLTLFWTQKTPLVLNTCLSSFICWILHWMWHALQAFYTTFRNGPGADDAASCGISAYPAYALIFYMNEYVHLY